jgi:hypothetical protein
MSRAQMRVDIAAALSEVAGITGHARRPGTIRAGDAWPLWRGAERGAGSTYVDTFAVFIALPGNEDSADEFVDDKGGLVEDALRRWLFVDSMAPAILGSDAGDSYGLMIMGRTEL